MAVQPQLNNSAEGGTSGTTVSTGNSGGFSGNAWDAVAIGTNCTLTYSNAQAAHGGLSTQYVTPAVAANCITEWTTSLTGSSVSQAWYRVYVYLPALPGSQLRIARALNGVTYCGGIAITAGGNIVTLNASGGTQTTSTTVVPTNQWFRLEGFVIGSATTGQVEVKIFTTHPDSATPDETNTSGAAINTNAAITRVDFGNPTSVASYTLFLDDLGASTTGYLGPVLTFTNTFEGGTPAATITTGNSGAGSGRAFDNVVIQAANTAIYDATHVAHGGVAAEFATGAGAGTSLTEYTTSMGTQTTIYFRLYCYLAATPTPAVRAFSARSGATHAGSVLFFGTQILMSIGSGFSAALTFTNPPPVGQWFRFEGFITGDASAGAIGGSLFTSMDSTTATETKTATGLNTTGALTQYWFGQANSAASSGPFWLDDVGISNSQYLGPVVTLSNTFEGGTAGTTLTTGNTGGASGNAFDAINTGAAGSVIVFDKTHVAQGNLSCKISTAGSAGTPLAEWTTSIPTQGTAWYRMYLYLTANPASGIRVVTFRAWSSLAAAIGISTTGKLQLINSGGSAAVTFTNAVPLNRWCRIEGYITGDPAAGAINCSLYVPDSTPAALETETATSQNTTGVLDQYWFGESVSLANAGPFWMDAIGISSAAALGVSAVRSSSATSIVPSLIAAGAI